MATSNNTSLYSSTSSNAVVNSRNYTTLYSASTGTVSAQTPYGNANVAGFLAEGSDTGGNSIGNITAAGIISAQGNIVTDANFIGTFIGNISGNIAAAGANTQVQYNNAGGLGASSAFTFNQASNVLSIGGNVTANYLIGNGSQITGLTSTYGNANVAAFLPTYTGNLSGGNLALTGNALITGGLTTSNNIVSGANIQAAGNIRTTGVSGNITGVNYASANFFVGNGSLLTGVVATSSYGNANVVANLAALGSNPVSTTGNISAGYFLGNGSQLTGLPATYGNANVATFMAAFGSNSISTSGNVSSAYFVGNGSLLTNLTGANVTGTVANATYATTAGSATTAGTVTTNAQANITSVGTLTSLSVSGNVQAGNVNTAGVISATGNVTGSYFLGNGSQLTGLPDAYGNSNVAAFMAAFGSNTITTTGNVVLGNVTAGTGNVSATNHVVNGLTANGSGWLGYQGGNTARMALNYVNGNNNHALAMRQTKAALYVDNIGSGANEAYAEIQMDIANVNAPYVLIDVAPGSTGIEYDWIFDATGNLTLPTNSSQIKYANGTSILSGIGGYGNSNVAAFMAAFGSNTITTTGNVVAGNLSVTGGITSTGNIVGQLSTAGNVTAGNITVNGLINTSGSLSLTGNISATGNIVAGNVTLTAGGVYSTTGNVQAGNLRTTGLVSATGNVTANNFSAGNSLFLNTTVEVRNYNNRLYSTDAEFNTLTIGTVAGITGNVQAGNLLTGGLVSATGNVTGNYFLGNGSQLTGLPATYGNANVATFMAAFGSNTITTTGNIVSGNISVGNANVDGRNINILNLNGGSNAVIGRRNTAGKTNQAWFQYTNANGLPAGDEYNHALQYQPTRAQIYADYYNNTTGLDTYAEIDFVVNNTNTPVVSVILGRADTGAEISWNYDITGNITLPGNTSAINYANGTSILSGIGGYGNANVVANLAALGSNPVSTTGNITAGYFLGNGSQLTGIVSSYGNANVAANLAAFGSNPISTTGNITAGTGIINAASVSGNISGNSSSNGVRVINYKDNVYALTYAATITPDAANGSIQQVTLTGNVTWNAFGGTPQAGQSMVVSLTQDGTGSRTLSSTMKFAGGSKTLSTAAGSIDIISVFYDGTNYFASLTKGYA
jgi:hypothetical protein